MPDQTWSDTDALRPLDDGRGIHCAGLALHFPALMENGQRRNAADAIACPQHLFLFCIHFQQAEVRFQLHGSLFKGGRRGAAPAA